MEIISTEPAVNEVEAIVWPEALGVSETRQRLQDRLLLCYSIDPGSLNVASGEGNTELYRKQKEYLTDNSNHSLFVNTIRKIYRDDEVHQLLMERKYQKISRELIENKIPRNISEKERERLGLRIDVFLRYSLDLEIIKLRVCQWEADGKIDHKLLECFLDNHDLQVNMCLVLGADVFSDRFGNTFEHKHDMDLIRGFSRKWARKSEFFDDRHIEQAERLFMTSDGEPSEYVISGKVRDCLESMINAGVHPIKTKFNYEAEIKAGQYANMRRVEEKVETTRFYNVAENMARILMRKLLPAVPNIPKVEKYALFLNEDSIPVSFMAYSENKLWGTYNSQISINNWRDLTKMKGDISFEEYTWDKKSQGYRAEQVLARMDLHSIITTAHELMHHWLFKTFEEQITPEIKERIETETKRPGEMWIVEGESGKKLARDVEFSDRPALYESLNEGLAILVEGLLMDELSTHPEILSLSSEDIKQFDIRKKFRGFIGNISEDRYKEGLVLIWNVYMEGYRKNKDVNEGLEGVFNFFKLLDLEKITRLDSRDILNNTTIEDELTSIGHKRIIAVVDGKEIVKTEEVRKNKLMDYLISGNPKKRKRGYKKFLYMFGKKGEETEDA